MRSTILPSWKLTECQEICPDSLLFNNQKKCPMFDVDFKDKKRQTIFWRAQKTYHLFRTHFCHLIWYQKSRLICKVVSPFSCLLGCSKCRTLKSSSPKLYQSRLNRSAFQFNQDTTHLALNATQGHKRSFKPGYSSYSNATQGHKHWLFIQPLIDLYPITRYDLNPTNFNGIQLL